MRKPKIDLIDGKYRTGGIPVPVLHVLLFRLIKDWTMDFRKGKLGSVPRHPSFLIAYHKGFQVVKRVHAVSPGGKALCLLKTQIAKKPKNPV